MTPSSSKAEVAVIRTGMSVADQPFYLRSGELIYFRLPPDAWRDRLMRLTGRGG